MDQIQQLVLQKLDQIDQKLDRYTERVVALEAKVDPILDNGQPGQLSKLDARVTAIEQTHWKAAGWLGSCLVFLEIVGHLFWNKLLGGK